MYKLYHHHWATMDCTPALQTDEAKATFWVWSDSVCALSGWQREPGRRPRPLTVHRTDFPAVSCGGLSGA